MPSSPFPGKQREQTQTRRGRGVKNLGVAAMRAFDGRVSSASEERDAQDLAGPTEAREAWLANRPPRRIGKGAAPLPFPWEDPHPGQGAGRLAVLTGAGVQRFGPDQERRTDGVKRKFLEVIAGLLGEDLVDHEGLVAPPACLGAPGRGQPGLRLGLGLAVHCGAARRPRGWGAAGGCQTRGRSRMGRPAPPSAATPPPRLLPPPPLGCAVLSASLRSAPPLRSAAPGSPAI